MKTDLRRFDVLQKKVMQVFAFILLFTLIPVSSFGQELQKVSGNVTDSFGEPMVGLTVLIKGTTTGGITDVDGHYELNVPADATLVFSFIGMVAQEIPVAGQSVIDVSMEEEMSILNEIVAVGYGSARKKDLSGSVLSMKLEDSPVASLPNTSILESLQGTAAGLNVGPSNSAGGTPQFRIRGQKTLAGSNDPLIVLDGVVYLGEMQDINPADISSMEILKDASAAAIYGSRAANGVIIMTSKKGGSEKPVFKLDVSTGVNTWQQQPKIMSGEKWAERVVEQQGAADIYEVFNSVAGGSYLADNYDSNTTTDWMDMITRAGQFQNYQLSFSGRNEQMNYFISGGYLDEEGAILGDDYSRINFRGKFDVHLKEWLKVGFDGAYTYTDKSGAQAGVYYGQAMNPYGIAYTQYDQTQLERYPTGESVQNPVWGVKNADNVYDNLETYNNVRGSGYVNIDVPFIKGLSYKFSYSRNASYNMYDSFTYEGYYVPVYDSAEDAQTNYENRYSSDTQYGYLSSAGGTTRRENINSYVMDNVFTYKRAFGKHYINVMAGTTRDRSYERNIYTYGSDFSEVGSTALGYNGLGNAATVTAATVIEKTTNVGYFGRLMYTFKDRYHFTGTVRRDGASVFGDDNKWGNFGSVGLAWTMSDESFIKDLDLFDLLKVRVSYGVNGNQSVDPYKTITSINTGASGGISYAFSDGNVVYGSEYSSTLGNENLGWEQTSSLNFGFDAAILDNRISLNADGYVSKTTDLLYEADVPLMTGYTTTYVNLGRIDNWGVEFTLETQNIEHANFTWSSKLSYWLNRNQLKELYESGEDIPADGFILGEPLYTIYGYKDDGIVQADDTDYMDTYGMEAGDVKFVDKDGDQDIDSEDRQILGHTQENFKASLSNTFTYKNLSFYFLLTGIFGGNNYYLQNNTGAYVFDQDLAMNTSWDHTWYSAEHPSNKYPRAGYSDSRFEGLQSRGFVKIQDISLSYNMNNLGFVKAMKINSCRVYGSIKNLHTFTNWDGTDPESESGFGALSSSNPVPTIYSVGLNLSF